MAATYSSFLSSPTLSLLAVDASLVYITTTTEIKEPAAILKHLASQAKQLEKKDEKILNAIESQDGLCLETETTLLFKAGGGAYLPGIDDNHLDERIVTLPLTHVVRFDDEQKIKQIRLYWDQSTLLKQVEVIGKTGRNWPIRDGRAQIEAINKSLNAGGRTTDMNGTAAAPRGPNDVIISQHRKQRDSVSATSDPHASLALFQPRDPNEDAGSRYEGPRVNPRDSAKPQARDLSQILAGEDMSPPPGAKQLRSPSPNKPEGTVFKAGAGKHHVSNRLFDEDDTALALRSPERKKVFKEKYEHFAFGDGEDAPGNNRPIGGKGSKTYQSQINFEDFHTPPSVKEKNRPDYERHWGAGVQEDDPPSPAKRPVIHAPRKDADKHFQFGDSPAVDTPKPKSYQRQQGMGLYADPLHADERAQISRGGAQREHDYSAHHNPAHYTPDQPKKIYKTAGDGMGGHKVPGRPKRERAISEHDAENVDPVKRPCSLMKMVRLGSSMNFERKPMGDVTATAKNMFGDADVAPDECLSEDDAESWHVTRKLKPKLY